MIFKDLRDDRPVDTATAPIAVLIGTLMYLAKFGGAPRWVEANGGAGAAQRFCRALRARLFSAHEMPYGKIRAWLNQLDPPRCRCGQPGTRIIGALTFCATCGPAAAMQDRLMWNRARHDGKQAATAEARRLALQRRRGSPDRAARRCTRSADWTP